MSTRLRVIIERIFNAKRPSDREKAVLDLLQFEPRKKDLSQLYWAVQQSFPDDHRTGDTARGTLLRKLRRVHDLATLTFIREIFPRLPANPSTREDVLNTLSAINTPESLQTLCDLLVKYEPKLCSDDNVVFAPVVRKPRHADVMFPKLLRLLANRSYRRGIYEVAAAALDSDAISASQLAPARLRLIQDFRRALRSMTRTKPESFEYQGRLEYVVCILNVMGAFPGDAGFRKVIQSSFERKETQIAFAAFRICRRHDWGLPIGGYERFAADSTTRLDFFEFLKTQGRKDEFPCQWRTQEAFAEGDLVRCTLENGQPPYKLKHLETRVVKLVSEKGRVYIYKMKRPSSTREWVIGVSGPQPIDRSKVIIRAAGTFCYDWTLRDMSIDEHIETMKDEIAKARKGRNAGHLEQLDGVDLKSRSRGSGAALRETIGRGISSSKRTNSIEPSHSHPSVDAVPIARMTTEQLHLYANDYNWDGGIGPMRRIIRKPRCDLGTALLIYWRIDPRFYYESWSRGGSAGIGTPEVAMLKEIERKVRSGRFKTAAFPFSPSDDLGHDWTAGTRSSSAIGIPAFMCDPVLARQSDFRAFRKHEMTVRRRPEKSGVRNSVRKNKRT